MGVGFGLGDAEFPPLSDAFRVQGHRRIQVEQLPMEPAQGVGQAG